MCLTPLSYVLSGVSPGQVSFLFHAQTVRGYKDRITPDRRLMSVERIKVSIRYLNYGHIYSAPMLFVSA